MEGNYREEKATTRTDVTRKKHLELVEVWQVKELRLRSSRSKDYMSQSWQKAKGWVLQLVTTCKNRLKDVSVTSYGCDQCNAGILCPVCPIINVIKDICSYF